MRHRSGVTWREGWWGQDRWHWSRIQPGKALGRVWESCFTGSGEDPSSVWSQRKQLRLPKSHYPIKQAFHSQSWNMISGHSWPLISTQLFPKEFYMPPECPDLGAFWNKRTFPLKSLSIKKLANFFSCASKLDRLCEYFSQTPSWCKAQCSFYRWGNWDPRRLGRCPVWLSYGRAP